MKERTIHESVDVLVIGSGCAGSIVCKTLAEAGARVTCLEQGHWWQPEDFPHYSADWEWQRLNKWNTAVNVREQAHDYPVDSSDEMTLMWSGVGGATTIYTATWPRFRPSDFRKGQEHGLAPDWPICYEDLAPHYEATDQLVGVSGLVGDPMMPPRGPFQTQPLPPTALGRIAANGFKNLGWHHWPMPCAILAEDFDGRLSCNHCGNCQNGCPRGSMNSVGSTIWPKALTAGTELRTHARVEQIETDSSGRATGAVYIDRNSGVRHFQPADRVVVSCNGVGTPRLLLLSAGGKHANGLANSSDQVGRNLMHHTLSVVEMWTENVLDSHKGVVSAALISEEFAETDRSRGFVNGLTLHIIRLNGAGYQALGSHSGNAAPWGNNHHAHFRKHFGHGLGVLIVGDDIPQQSNRVTLSDSITDSSGLPAPRINYALHENDKKQLKFGIDRAVDLAGAVDAFDYRVNDLGLSEDKYCPPAWHLLGTCRMGENPESSVTDKWHRAWDCPNLYIIDGSSIVTGAAVNPTSTISALAHRAAKHMLT